MNATQFILRFTVTLFLLVNGFIFGFIVYKSKNNPEPIISNKQDFFVTESINSMNKGGQNEEIIFNSTESVSEIIKPPVIEPINPESADDFYIIAPFANDVFWYQPNKPDGFQKIKLEASISVDWLVNDEFIGRGKTVLWNLKKGSYEIKAINGSQKKTVRIEVR